MANQPAREPRLDDTVEVEALRDHLKGLRASSGLSQPAVAQRMRTTQPSVARWESPDPKRITVPTHEQLERLLDVYDASNEDRKLAADLRRWVDEARLPSLGMVLSRSSAMQQRVADLERESATVQTYMPMVVPGVFQTEAYMRLIFEGANVTGSELEGSVAARLSRRNFVAEPHREWTILLTEGALRWALGGPVVMAEQCRYLASIDLPNVRLGVVTERNAVGMVVMHGFDLYGTDPPEAMVGTLIGTARVPSDDEKYPSLVSTFAQVEAAASFGDDARAVFADAADRYDELASDSA